MRSGYDLDPDGLNPPGHPAGPGRPGLLQFVLCLAQFMLVLDTSIVNVALPVIGDRLGFATTTQLQYVISLYSLTLGGFLIIGGRTADLIGAKRVFLAGSAWFALASAVCGLAGEPAVLLVGRLLQGAGAALTSAAGLAILTQAFPAGPRRNRALAAWGAIGGAAGATGLVIGGLITQVLGWPWIFLINLPVVVLIIVVGGRVIPDAHPVVAGRPRLDLRAALCLTLGIGLLIFGLSRAGEHGIGDPLTLAALVGVAPAALIFLVIERRSDNPVVPARLLRFPGTAAAYTVALLLNAVIASTLFFTTLFLQLTLHFSPVQTGLGFLPNSCLVVVGSVLGSRMATRVGARRSLLLGILAVGGGALLLAGVWLHQAYLMPVLPGFALIGLGLGLSFTSFTIIATQAVPPADQGVASGVLGTTQQVGFALGIAAVVGLAGQAPDPVSGYAVGYLIDVGLAAVAGIVTVIALRRR